MPSETREVCRDCGESTEFEKRTARVTVNMTPTEKKYLTALAKVLHMTPSTLLQEIFLAACLDENMTDDPDKTVHQWIALIKAHKQRINLDQMRKISDGFKYAFCGLL